MKVMKNGTNLFAMFKERYQKDYLINLNAEYSVSPENYYSLCNVKISSEFTVLKQKAAKTTLIPQKIW